VSPHHRPVPRLRIVPDEPDQVARLERFRDEHPPAPDDNPDGPGVLIIPPSPDTPQDPWRAHVNPGTFPRDGRQTFIVHRRLRDMLDDLEARFAEEENEDTG
jgi:hypothetical protein